MYTRILLAALTPAERQRWLTMLSAENVVVATLNRKADLPKSLQKREHDIVVVNRSLLADPVHQSISAIRQSPSAPDLIVLAEVDNAEERSQLLSAGCLAVLNIHQSDDALRETLAALIDRLQRQDQQQMHGGSQPPRLSDFVSSSPIMQEFMKVVRRVVSADTPLLMSGETGVGKERLAAAIHAESPRSAGPFVAVNCGALPEGLLESELFGHEEGAFTGATRSRRGYFELAHQGTIFLDEVAEMPIHTQVKLLRVLQEHVIQRVGSEKPISLNVRVLAATNRDVLADVEARRFRQDLYYRLGVVTLTIPPLRERPEDVAPLVEGYINQFRHRLNSSVYGITPEALEALLHYHWPGNVRELINVVERAMLLCPEPRIRLSDLPPMLTGMLPVIDKNRIASSMPNPTLLAENWLDKPWKDARVQALAAFERAYLTGILRATGGRIGAAAKRAKMDPRSLYEKMKRHGMQKIDFRTNHSDDE